ncbi:MAG: hypothetical protein HC935_02620 [Pseudanabaena sp. SU_2_4]|nr:hypothetical protein [Pseudanabaena sp. SU_2_4]
MAVLQVEDLTGSSEAVIFPKTYEKVRSHLQKIIASWYGGNWIAVTIACS